MMGPTMHRTGRSALYLWALLLGSVASLAACKEPSIDPMDGAVPDAGATRDAAARDASLEASLPLDGWPTHPDVSVVDYLSPPRLDAAEMREVGRFGRDVRLLLDGDDPDRDLVAARVTWLDAAGAELLRFDTDADGTLDATEAVLPLDELPTSASAFRAAITFPRFLDAAPLAVAVRVSVLDSRGHESATMGAELVAQPEVSEGLECDPTFERSRCGVGLGCRRGTPSVCVPGTAPTIETAVYLVDPGVSRVLVLGRDSDDDITVVRLEFLDAEGAPVLLDLDGDSIDESTEFEVDVAGAGADGEFFVAIENGASFGDLVSRVAVTARDRGGRTSERRILARATTPTRRVGQPCDPRGFDACVASVCARTAPTRPPVCVSSEAARASACSGASMIPLVDGRGAVAGMTTSPSLWDAPAGCSSNDPTGRPEGAVLLRLATAATTVHLTTDNAATNFDTTIYVIAGCRSAPVLAWCGDDSPMSARAWASNLLLRDVPAGDYFVIVDSFSRTGGRFLLEATVE